MEEVVCNICKHTITIQNAMTTLYAVNKIFTKSTKYSNSLCTHFTSRKLQ